MRVQHIRASWAEASEVVREQYGLAQDVFKQHWIPITAAAAGLYCLWRFVRFIRHVSPLNRRPCLSDAFAAQAVCCSIPALTGPDLSCMLAQLKACLDETCRVGTKK